MNKKKINLAYKNIINKNGWFLPYEILKNSIDEFNKNTTELLILNDYKIEEAKSTIIGKVDKINLVKDGISSADIILNTDIDLNNKELFICYVANIETKTKKDTSKIYNECSNIVLNYCTIKDKKLSCYNIEIKMPPKTSKFIMYKVY